MTGFSFGHRWVGVESGHEPPPQSAIHRIASNSSGGVQRGPEHELALQLQLHISAYRAAHEEIRRLRSTLRLLARGGPAPVDGVEAIEGEIEAQMRKRSAARGLMREANQKLQGLKSAGDGARAGD